MQLQVIVNQILILALISIIGVLAVKIKIVNHEVKETLSKIVFNITLPLLLFTTMTHMDFTGELFRNGLIVFVFTFISISLLFLSGLFSTKLFNYEDKAKAVHITHTMFGNIVFLGFPLFNALFPGGIGLFYAAVYQLAQGIVLWTFGVVILNKSSGNKNLLKNLVNPNTIAFLLGIVAMIIRFKLPFVFDKALGGLGQTTIYLSMLYIGAMLADTKIKDLFQNKNSYILSFNKMILVPVVLVFIVTLAERLLNLNFILEAKTVLIMQTATPCMATIVVLAKRFNSDDRQATINVFVSTILSILTLPLIFWIIQNFS